VDFKPVDGRLKPAKFNSGKGKLDLPRFNITQLGEEFSDSKEKKSLSRMEIGAIRLPYPGRNRTRTRPARAGIV